MTKILGPGKKAMMKPSELLTEAAAYLAEHGHCKGDLKTEDGRVCLQGAMCMPLLARGWMKIEKGEFYTQGSGTQLFTSANRAVARELNKEGIPVSYDTHVWNDASETTKEDVLLMMKRAAHTLAEEGK